MRDYIVTVMARDRVGIVRDVKAGERAVFGGLYGESPIFAVQDHTSDAFVRMGGRIPAPLTSLTSRHMYGILSSAAIRKGGV